MTITIDTARDTVETALASVNAAYWSAAPGEDRASLLEASRRMIDLRQQLAQQQLTENTESFTAVARGFQLQVLPAIQKLQTSLANSQQMSDTIRGVMVQLEQVIALGQFFGI